jgi:hypothetical protein
MGKRSGKNRDMTSAKKWPQQCEDARLECISLAMHSVRLLIETLDHVSEPGALRNIAKVINDLRAIENQLCSVKHGDM